MDILQDLGPDDRMKVGLHEVENQVQIFMILCPDQMLQSDDVGVAIQLPQKDDFTECALGIGGILECIEHFFDG